MACLRLRVKDLEFEQRIITARDGKGTQDRGSDVQQPVCMFKRFSVE
jgi:hypothetical protein